MRTSFSRNRRAVRTMPNIRDAHPERAWPIMLSARSEEALRGTASAAGARGSTSVSSANGASPVLPDLTYTLGARRNHHPHRLTLVAHSMSELIQELDAFGDQAGQRPRPAPPSRRAASTRRASLS